MIQSTAVTLSLLVVYYRLQVSPAPAVATFGDVPVGHPQRQYIEALVASAITRVVAEGTTARMRH